MSKLPPSRRTVVVTGASGGIGRATARMLGARGDRVGLLARGEVGLEAAAQEVERAGGRALPIPVDVSNHAALDEVADRVEGELGPVDAWINVAFTSVFARFEDIQPHEYKRVTDVTYLGYVNGTRTALRLMRPRDRA